MVFPTATLIAWILQYRYLILLPIAIVEGPIISIICGVLISQGQLNLWIVYAIVIFGDLIGDVVWYYIGYHFGYRFVRKWGARFGLTEEKIQKVKERFHKHKNPILFLSKITNGLGLALAVLFTAGLSKIPFKRYMLINLVGQFIWSGVLLSIGCFFGSAINQVKSIEGKVSIFSAAVIILFFTISYIRQLHNRII